MDVALSRPLAAYGLLAGGVIGAGIFGLPAAAARAGMSAFLLEGLLVVAVAWLLQVIFADVVLATPGRHRIPGYAELYLGRWGKLATVFSNVLGLIGALLAYLIAGGEFLRLLLEPFLAIGTLQAALLYFACGALLIYRGVRKVAAFEVLIVLLFFVTLLGLSFEARGVFSWARLQGLGAGESFLPYGVLLFSFWGLSLIPDTVEQAGRAHPSARRVIAASTLTAAFVYLAFVILVLGVTGQATTPEALGGLAAVLGRTAVSLGLLFGILTTFSSFIALGLVLEKTFAFDFRLPKIMAWVLAMFAPLGIYLLGARELVSVLGLTGAVFLGTEGLILLLVAARCRRQCGRTSALLHPLLLSLLALALVAGVALELASVLF